MALFKRLSMSEIESKRYLDIIDTRLKQRVQRLFERTAYAMCNIGIFQISTNNAWFSKIAMETIRKIIL